MSCLPSPSAIPSHRTNVTNNEPSLSHEHHAFLEIIERGIHKNASCNWEMPLPFRDERQTMPKLCNAKAMQCLQGLLKTFNRKPEMSSDYLEFMGKTWPT